MKLVIKSYESWKYLQVHKITGWKDACIFTTEPVGFIHHEDSIFYHIDDYVLTSISTHLTKDVFCTLDPILNREEEV